MAQNGENPNSRVLMWCVPRSGSTVLTKCMSFVDGADIWLEPFVMSTSMANAYHAAHPDGEKFPLDLPGNEAIYRETAELLTLGGNVAEYNLHRLSPTFLKSTFDTIASEKKLVFIKDMAFTMLPGRYQYLPDKAVGFKHLFLIRNPLKVYISFRKAMFEHYKDLPAEMFEALGIQKPTEETLHIIDSALEFKESSKYFFESSYNLWNHVKKNIDENAVVLDIDDLLNDPSSMLPRLFEVLGISYSENRLTWDQSSDVITKWKSCCPDVCKSPRYAKWFTQAFESSCFRKPGPEPSLEDATKDVQEIVEREMPFYKELYKARIII